MDETFYYNKRFFSDQFPFHLNRFLHRTGDHSGEVFHRREFWKITAIISGKGALVIKNQSFPIEAGSIFLSHPDSLTKYRIDSGALGVCNLLFLPKLFAAELDELEGNFDFFSIFRRQEPEITELYIVDRQRKLMPVIQSIEYEYKRKQSNFRVMIRMRMVELLVLFARASFRGFRAPSNDYIVRYIEHWINRGFREKRSLDLLAEETGTDKSRLCVLYRRATGATIMNTLRERRLAEARRLLVETDWPAGEIGFRSGFIDLSHFYHAFQRSYGMKPSEFRAQNRSTGLSGANS